MDEPFDIVLYVDGQTPAGVAAQRCLDRVRPRFDVEAARFAVCDVSREVERAAADRVVFTPAVIARRAGRPCITVIGALNDDALLRALVTAGVPPAGDGEPWVVRRQRELSELEHRVVELEKSLRDRAQREATMTLMLEQADLDTAAAHLFQAQHASDEATARHAIEAALRVLKRWN